MKINNEYIQIKIGDKIWTHKNIILDEYLKKLFNSQIDKNHDECYISCCFIKFDTVINVEHDSTVYPNQFDLKIRNTQSEINFFKKTNLTGNSIKINYTFDQSSSYNTGSTWGGVELLNNFLNRKITGIGFGVDFSSPIFAYLDTSNMNIVINANEYITITRVDTISSDGTCEGIDYPLHLVNDLAFKNTSTVIIDEEIHFKYTKAVLYSVGFGNVKGIMEDEHIINNEMIIDRDDTSIIFNVVRDKKTGIYPSSNLKTGFIPLKDNSKYIIFKYRLYDILDTGSIFELDKYYTMNALNEDFGNLNIKLKIERL